MPNEKEKINFGGREIEATPIEVNQSNERWNEYILDDGSVVKIKLVLKKAVRAEGEYDPEGNPVYLIQTTNVVTVSAPKELRKPK